MFSPRQLMSDNEGREVIVNYIKKIRPVISELSFIFLLHSASRHHVSVWPRGPGLRRVWVKRDLSLLRGTFCAKGWAVDRNKPEPNQPSRSENMDHFVTWSDIRTEHRMSTETADSHTKSQLSLDTYLEFVVFLSHVQWKISRTINCNHCLVVLITDACPTLGLK